jgi:hypothetical protein
MNSPFDSENRVKRGFNLRGILEAAQRRIAEGRGLSKEAFCYVLERLPMNFTFTIKQISDQLDGEWVKVQPKQKETGRRVGRSVWYNAAKQTYISGPLFYIAPQIILEAICDSLPEEGSGYSVLGTALNKWSLKYDCCVECGRTDAIHVTGGLCLNCYKSLKIENGPGPLFEPRTKPWSGKFDRCVNCGRDDVRLVTGGLCVNCHELKMAQEVSSPVTETTSNQAIQPITKRWSKKYDCCVSCGRNDVKHVSRGLCSYCYETGRNRRLSEGRKRHKHGVISEKLTYRYLVEEYLNKKKSLEDIAKECGCTRQFIYKKLLEFNMPARTKTHARQLVYEKQKMSYPISDENGKERMIVQRAQNFNQSFFKSWSKEMAYVLGVIYTDGNLFHDKVRKLYRVSLTQKEPEILNKVLNLMDCDARLLFKKQRGIAGSVYRFDLQGKELFNDLVSLGASERKSKTIEFPNVPSECVRHFIRGCWDGDGSVYLEGDWKIRASYISGSLKFIENVVEELYKAGLSKAKAPADKATASEMLLKYPDGRYPLKIHKDNRVEAYYIKVDSKENLTKLFEFFYDGVDESMYLKRKFDTFAKGLNIITEDLKEASDETERG